MLNKVKTCIKEDLKLEGQEWKDADPEVRKLLNQRDKLKIVDDVLYRHVQNDVEEVLQYVVPLA